MGLRLSAPPFRGRVLAAAALIAVTLLAGASLTSLAGPTTAPAAPPACDSVIPVFQDAITNCREINNDYACYGTFNTKGDALNQPREKLRFKLPEDRAPIERFQTLATLAYRTTYGAALMRLTQAGQDEPVTAILFGDATLKPTDAAAGRLFTLTANAGNPVCAATPPGLAVRVPSGKTGRITINGVEITLGSTAYIATTAPTQTIIANLEGNVVAAVPGINARVALPRGQQTVVTLQNGFPIALSAPGPSPYAASPLLQWLATKGLPQVIDPNSEPVANRPACGGAIAFGQSIVQQNAAPGQECLYNFCANAGDVATVTMERVQGSLDPYLDLRNPDHSLLKWNDDSAPGNTNALICNQTLPISGCDYTIVARASGNDSNGAFRVTLNGQSACQAPPANCQVTPSALNLRSGPGPQFARVATLQPGTKLFRLSGAAGDPWIRVQVAPTGPTGWIAGDSELTYCDDGTVPAPAPDNSSGNQGGNTPVPPTVPPPPPPTPPKAGPFPGP